MYPVIIGWSKMGYKGVMEPEGPDWEPDNWTYGYPGGSTDRSLGKRYTPPSWWEIEDPATGNPRWAIVPVVHPSSWGKDPGYRQSRKIIAAARRRIRHWPVV
jgi:hypothetical protein